MVQRLFMVCCLFFPCSQVLAEQSHNLAFPDSCGKIVKKKPEYIIRLVETPHSSAKTVEAIFIAQGEPRTFNRIVSDCKQYPEFMPHIRSAVFVGMDNSRPIYRFSFKVSLWTVWYSNVFTNEVVEPDHFILRWDYVEGTLKNTKGSWDISRYKEKTGYSLIRYRLWIETGMPVPAWLNAMLTSSSVETMIKAIGDRARFLEKTNP